MWLWCLRKPSRWSLCCPRLPHPFSYLWVSCVKYWAGTLSLLVLFCVGVMFCLTVQWTGTISPLSAWILPLTVLRASLKVAVFIGSSSRLASVTSPERSGCATLQQLWPTYFILFIWCVCVRHWAVVTIQFTGANETFFGQTWTVLQKWCRDEWVSSRVFIVLHVLNFHFVHPVFVSFFF